MQLNQTQKVRRDFTAVENESSYSATLEDGNLLISFSTPAGGGSQQFRIAHEELPGLIAFLDAVVIEAPVPVTVPGVV